MTRPKRRSKRKTPETGGPRRSSADATPHTAIIDIGGTGIKMIVIDSRGEALNELIEKMAKTLPPIDRVSVGFPGVVMYGVAKNAPNLGTSSGPELKSSSVSR